MVENNLSDNTSSIDRIQAEHYKHSKAGLSVSFGTRDNSLELWNFGTTLEQFGISRDIFAFEQTKSSFNLLASIVCN